MSQLENRLKKDFIDKECAYAYVNEFLNASIATQIETLREQRGWTQNELAALAGMKQPRISRLEDINYYRWTISTLKKLAEAFDVTLKVSFESFSTRIGDIENFNRESLERTSRMEDLSSSLKEQAMPKEFASVSPLSPLKLNFDTSDNFSLQSPNTALTNGHLTPTDCLADESVYQLKEAA